MQTLVIYDTSGRIISQMAGSSLQEPSGIPFLWEEIPEGKYLVSVDTTVTPNAVVMADLPKSDVQILQDKLDALSIDHANLAAITVDLLGGI